MEYMKKDLAEIWSKKSKVLFGNYQTVRQAEVVQLLDDLPNRFGKKAADLPQKSKYKPKSKEGDDIQSNEARMLNWKSGYNDRAKVIDKHVDKIWGRKLDYVSSY